MNTFTTNQRVANIVNGKTLIEDCTVIEYIQTDYCTHVRVCDTRYLMEQNKKGKTPSFKQLIARGHTFCVPEENLKAK